jgi:hypothetical protein
MEYGRRIGARPEAAARRMGWGCRGLTNTYTRAVGAIVLACSLAATPAWALPSPLADIAADEHHIPIGAPRGHDPMPDPGLAPDDVVGIMLQALQHNDDPVADHGIAITFAFTSPENHDITGPFERFRALVKSPAYRLMIGHSKAERGPVTVVADHARERVAITGPHGDRAVYVFLLSRQELGSHRDCWMADGMLRETDPAHEGQHRSMMTPIVWGHE